LPKWQTKELEEEEQVSLNPRTPPSNEERKA
jgi:hypothetical protein